jgi:hypothetical protein
METLPAAASAGLPKVVEDQRIALCSTTRDMLDCVDQPESVSAGAKKQGRGEWMPPSAALVQFALAYSTESDPVAMADACADYVKRLMPTMMLYLADNNSPQGAEMGQQFGEMIRFGVYRPLELATAKAPEPLKDQADRIFKNAAQTVADMEKHLEKAGKGNGIGLERAVQASKKVAEKGKGWGKGKDKDNPGKANKDDGGKGPRNMQVTLKSLDAARNAITVVTRVQGKDAERTFGLSKELQAVVNLAVLQADPKTGVRLQLQLSEDRRTVIGVQIGGNDQSDKEN